MSNHLCSSIILSLRPNCEICMQIVPLDPDDSMFKSCCGKMICRGCNNASNSASDVRHENVFPCPFCRTDLPVSDNEIIERYRTRIKVNSDTAAMVNMGHCYSEGKHGLAQSRQKAIKLFEQAYNI